jgi:hypothetical protein
MAGSVETVVREAAHFASLKRVDHRLTSIGASTRRTWFHRAAAAADAGLGTDSW